MFFRVFFFDVFLERQKTSFFLQFLRFSEASISIFTDFGVILGTSWVIFSMIFQDLILESLFVKVFPKNAKTQKMEKQLRTCKIRCFVRVARLKKNRAGGKNSLFFFNVLSIEIDENSTKKTRKTALVTKIDKKAFLGSAF